jgi:hypothetical protein
MPIPIIQYSTQFKNSILALIIAYFAILIRCIYRIAEMAGGWRNPIMQNQAAFVVCDGVMCVVACVVLNIFHPGEVFGTSKEMGGPGEGSGNSISTDTNVEVGGGDGDTDEEGAGEGVMGMEVRDLGRRLLWE